MGFWACPMEKMVTSLKQINECEVCHAPDLKHVLNLGNQPLCDDLKTINSNQQNILYPVSVLFCSNCYTAHQQYQVPKELLFHKDYHYRASLTKDVLNGMSNLVDEIKLKKKKLLNLKVLDVGCNDGSLLGFFKTHGAVTIGVEPTDAINDSQNKIDFKYKQFFNKRLAEKILLEHSFPDVITFTNVFAHIDNLPSLLEAVKVLVGPDTILVIENHYLGSVIENLQFDTFYHEHPRTYSIRSFEIISKILQLRLIDVQLPNRYGGNVRAFLSKSNDYAKEGYSLSNLLFKEKKIVEKIFNLESFLDPWKKETILKLNEFKRKKLKVAAKAFPARASIIINYLGIDKDLLPCVLEQFNSKKNGHLVPGTSIPIIGSEDFNNYDVIVNLAWHINDEISAHLENKGFKGELYSILPKFEKIR